MHSQDKNNKTNQQTGWYYYGARYYDPTISRWLSVDPLTENYQNASPYNYTLNNPVMFVDPDGRSVEDTYTIDKKGNVRHIDDKKYYDKNGKEVDRLYVSKKKYGIDVSKGYIESKVQKDGSSVISRLAHSVKTRVYGTSEIDGPTFKANQYITIEDKDFKKELWNVFDFVSKNSNVEWSLIKFINLNREVKYQIGTFGLGKGIEGQFGYPYSPSISIKNGKIVHMIHSHPDEIGAENELSSMDGDRSVGFSYLKEGVKTYQVFFPKNNKTRQINRFGKPTSRIKRLEF